MPVVSPVECTGLLRDLSGLGTSKAWDMGSMFWGCSHLKELDLSGRDTSSVTQAHGMLDGCTGLASFSVGPGYRIGQFPDPANGQGLWWSTAESAWYDKRAILHRGPACRTPTSASHAKHRAATPAPSGPPAPKEAAWVSAALRIRARAVPGDEEPPVTGRQRRRRSRLCGMVIGSRSSRGVFGAVSRQSGWARRQACR